MNDQAPAKPQLLEVLSFSTAENTPSASVLESMQGFVVEMNQYGTLPRKVIAHDKADWISVNYWQDEAAKERINKEAQQWESSKLFAPKINPASFQMASYLIHYGEEEARLSKEEASVLEYVYLKKLAEVDESDMAKLLHAFTPQMNQFGGLTDRVIAYNSEGDWVCINYWKSMQEMQKINSISSSFEGFKDFPKYAELSKTQLRPYFLRDALPKQEKVIEIAIRSVKEGMKGSFEANRETFIKTWMNNTGATVDREFASIFGMPTTENEKFIGMTSWQSLDDFQAAGNNPEVQQVAPDFMGTFDMLAFVVAKPIEGDFNLASLIQQEGEILELAIRRIKNPSEADEFHARRKAYVKALGQVEGVLASYELEVVMSGSGEHLTIGMTEYANQEAVDRAGSSVNQGPEAAAFLETMEVVTFNYLTKVK